MWKINALENVTRALHHYQKGRWLKSVKGRIAILRFQTRDSHLFGYRKRWWNKQTLVDEQKELMRDPLLMSMIHNTFKIRIIKEVVGKIYQQIVKPVPEWSTYNHSCGEKLPVKNENTKLNLDQGSDKHQNWGYTVNRLRMFGEIVERWCIQIKTRHVMYSYYLLYE